MDPWLVPAVLRQEAISKREIHMLASSKRCLVVISNAHVFVALVLNYSRTRQPWSSYPEILSSGKSSSFVWVRTVSFLLQSGTLPILVVVGDWSLHPREGCYVTTRLSVVPGSLECAFVVSKRI